MDTLINSYGINYTRFRTLLKSTNSMVAGNSALACYLVQERIDSGAEQCDIDIWVAGDLGVGYTNFKIFRDFLLSSGFKIALHAKMDKIYDYGCLNNIMQIVTFTNLHNKTIQLREIRTHNSLKYIRESFDLSMCITWWNVIDEQFCTAFPTLTKNKQMQLRSTFTNALEFETVQRLQKYKKWGFTLIGNGCPVNICKDDREILDCDNLCFNNILAFDTIEFNDVNLKEHLRASEWNIILKTNQTLYAFNRRTLIDLMKKRITYIKELATHVTDTPLNQSIHLTALSMLEFSDYSIYELEYVQSIKYKNATRIKSLYNMKCYSIKNYMSGVPDQVVYTPLPS